MPRNVQLFIDGNWRDGGGEPLPIINPATEETIGTVARATSVDLDEALNAAQRAFRSWRHTSPLVRGNLLRSVAQLLRARASDIAAVLTEEQGKTLVEARMECTNSADIFDWFAEEARRTYGRVIPSRTENVSQVVTKEPIGVVAAFTPWNFPVTQAVRKIAAALAAGCSIILKGPEETPASCAMMVDLFREAGLPAGVLQLVYGVPSEISEYLIPHPVIRKVSFTGSTVIGKRLAELAGRHMKQTTMELGGHAPVIVFDDADLDSSVKLLSAAKYRNAGQVCVSPTRFLVQKNVYSEFVEKFVHAAKAVRVGNGAHADSTMGAMANSRRIDAMESMVADAVKLGGNLKTGGSRVGNKGYFYQPTVLTEVPKTAKAMNDEPFGPMALISPFSKVEEAVEEANRLPYGLAAYAYTRSVQNARAISTAVESGMMSINHHGLALPETPFGGIKDSGHGSEGGLEAIESYLVTKFVTHAIV